MKMIIPRSERFDSVLFARIAQRDSLADEARMEYAKMLAPDFSNIWPAIMGQPVKDVSVTLMDDGVEVEMPDEMFEERMRSIAKERANGRK
jgi:hypothetical protein